MESTHRKKHNCVSQEQSVRTGAQSTTRGGKRRYGTTTTYESETRLHYYTKEKNSLHRETHTTAYNNQKNTDLFAVLWKTERRESGSQNRLQQNLILKNKKSLSFE